MEENTKEKTIGRAVPKFSTEQLEEIIRQQDARMQSMSAQMQQMNLTNIFKRLEFLFKIVENKGSFPNEFLNKVIEEIINMLTVPTEEDSAKKDN